MTTADTERRTILPDNEFFGIEASLVTDKTVIVAPVHQLQVVDEVIPETDHDFSVDLIITPDEVIECPGRSRPQGLVWKDITPEKIEAIPVLAEQVRHSARGASF